ESQLPALADGGQVRPFPADVALVTDHLARLNGIDPAQGVVRLRVEGAGLAGAGAAEQPTTKHSETRQAHPRGGVVDLPVGALGQAGEPRPVAVALITVALRPGNHARVHLAVVNAQGLNLVAQPRPFRQAEPTHDRPVLAAVVAQHVALRPRPEVQFPTDYLHGVDLLHAVRLSADARPGLPAFINVDAVAGGVVELAGERQKTSRVSVGRRSAVGPLVAVVFVDAALAARVNGGVQLAVEAGQAQNPRPVADLPQVAPGGAALVNE